MRRRASAQVTATLLDRSFETIQVGTAAVMVQYKSASDQAMDTTLDRAVAGDWLNLFR